MEPIYVAHLLPVLDAKLIELLRSLGAEDWNRRATPAWTVKQVAAHLLDGNLRHLSIVRDGYWGEPFGGNSYQDLVAFLNGLNDDWVKAFQRVSPSVLVDLLEVSNRQLADFFQSLDPHAPAVLAVSWAGEERSENWFDIAREYTEKWHHQQQIRDATGRDAIMGRELYFPVLDTFMRALPHGYREISAAPGTTLAVRISGEAGGDWFLCRDDGSWTLSRVTRGDIRASVSIPQELAWKLFTKGLPPAEAGRRFQFSGDDSLTRPLLGILAIMG